MKKDIICVISAVIIIFIFPALFTKQRNSRVNEIGEEKIINEAGENISAQEDEITNIPNETLETIKLLITNTSDVVELNLNDYLYSVVAAEMPVDFHIEALKSQSVVARTYTMYKAAQQKHENADICDNYACCQAYITKEDRFARWDDEQEAKWQRIMYAVNSTNDKIITYQAVPIEAFFHSNSGGLTEIPRKCMGPSRVSILGNSSNTRRRRIYSI